LDDNGEEVNKLSTASAGLLEESKPCGISVCKEQASADTEDSDLDSMKEDYKYGFFIPNVPNKC
jgi:hypothetical protein